MPQLMPLYWVNSMFMILFILITLVFFYFNKNLEMISTMSEDNIMKMYNYLW